MKTSILCRKFLLMALVFLISLIIVSCEKKWKKTAIVDVKFNFLRENTYKNILFNSGFMTIHEVKFSGDRKQGDNVDFTDNISNGSKIDFATGIASSSITYDIPQGTYTSISLEIKINEENIASPCIVFTGTYLKDNTDSDSTETDSTETDSTETDNNETDSTETDDNEFDNNETLYSNTDTIPIRFEFYSGEIFSVQAKAADGSNEIVLIEDQPATATITFNSDYWFALITPNLLNKASLSKVNNVPTIVISKDQNQNIYDLVVSRINQATKVIFK